MNKHCAPCLHYSFMTGYSDDQRNRKIFLLNKLQIGMKDKRIQKQQLAQMLGIKAPNISRLKHTSANPTMDMLLNIEHYTGIKIFNYD